MQSEKDTVKEVDLQLLEKNERNQREFENNHPQFWKDVMELAHSYGLNAAWVGKSSKLSDVPYVTYQFFLKRTLK